MKKLAKKFLAALLTAVIAVSGMVVTAVPAAAESIFDGAAELKEFELVSREFDDGESALYKITVPCEGSIKVKCSRNYLSAFSLINDNDDTLASGARSSKEFNVDVPEKGTYYLKVYDGMGYGSDIEKMYYTFTPSSKPVISLEVTMKKGDKIQLGAITENYDGKVTWKSTKKSVATVSSKGLVTAKKAGTTYIRAQLDNGDYVEIKVVVKKK